MTLHRYCVVYTVGGIYYRYRCSARTKTEARTECRKNMFPEKIIEVEIED